MILVLEGAARAAGPRIAERARVAAQAAPGSRTRPAGEGDGGTVQVVSAPGSGDDEIVRLAKSRPGRRIVMTADRELRRRCLAVGAQVAGPSWLYALLGRGFPVRLAVAAAQRIGLEGPPKAHPLNRRC